MTPTNTGEAWSRILLAKDWALNGGRFYSVSTDTTFSGWDTHEKWAYTGAK